MNVINRLLRMIETVRDLDPEMKIQTLDVLLRVANAGRSGIHMTELQRSSGMTLSSVSRNVATLSQQNMKGAKAWGFVLTTEDPMDRRYKVVYVTDRGQKFVDQVLKAVGE